MATLVITPLISAETWLGAAGWASGSQTWSGTSPAFEARAEQGKTKNEAARNGDILCARIASKA